MDTLQTSHCSDSTSGNPWYFDGVAKVPKPSFKKGRWLGFSWPAGDAFTYFIETERPLSEGRPVVLICSIIKHRRKNIGKPTEYVEENPALSNFFLSENELLVDAPHSLVGESSPGNEQVRDNLELNQQTDSNQTTTLQQSTELGENTNTGEEIIIHNYQNQQDTTNLIDTPTVDLDESFPQMNNLQIIQRN